MPYQHLSFDDDNKDHPVLVFVRKELDPLLYEFRNLLLIPHYIDIPIGSWQKSQIILLLSIIDGCAQLFIPGNMMIGERFKSFIKDNFPWTIDKPLNITPEEACELLWNDARCPVMHRLGIRYKPKATSTICYMRIHSTTDEDITRLETNTNVKPYNEPTIKKDKDKEKIFIFIESLYWCTRYAIQKSLDSKLKLDAVQERLVSGDWDLKNGPKKPLATPPPLK